MGFKTIPSYVNVSHCFSGIEMFGACWSHASNAFSLRSPVELLHLWVSDARDSVPFHLEQGLFPSIRPFRANSPPPPPHGTASPVGSLARVRGSGRRARRWWMTKAVGGWERGGNRSAVGTGGWWCDSGSVVQGVLAEIPSFGSEARVLWGW